MCLDNPSLSRFCSYNFAREIQMKTLSACYMVDRKSRNELGGIAQKYCESLRREAEREREELVSFLFSFDLLHPWELDRRNLPRLIIKLAKSGKDMTQGSPSTQLYSYWQILVGPSGQTSCIMDNLEGRTIYATSGSWKKSKIMKVHWMDLPSSFPARLVFGFKNQPEAEMLQKVDHSNRRQGGSGLAFL